MTDQQWLVILLQVGPWMGAAGAMYAKLVSIEKRLERGQVKMDAADADRVEVEARMTRIEQRCEDVQHWKERESIR